MDARLDPSCEGAVALTRRQQDQDALLVGGSTGQLATVVHAKHGQEVTDHLVACARCRHYEPGCATCGFDARRGRHGWMCPEQGSRWADLLPWNWRPRHAPPKPREPWKHVAANGTRPASAAPATAARPAPTPRPVVVPPGGAAARGLPQQPKPRARPSPPKPDALAVAYASLGLPQEASQEAVRTAYRARALQYHPDKVAHMAPEFRAVAETKMTELNAAYERIKRSWA